MSGCSGLAFPCFKKFEALDREKYLYYFNKTKSKMADQSFLSRLAWSSNWRFLWTEFADSLLVFYDSLSLANERNFYFSCPLGLQSFDQLSELVRGLEKVVYEHACLCILDDEQGKIGHCLNSYVNRENLSFLFVEEEYLPWFLALDGYEAEIIRDRDYADYLYSAEAMRTFSGKKLHAKKNLVNRFWKMYDGAQYVSLGKEHFEDCLALARLWGQAKAANHFSSSLEFEDKSSPEDNSSHEFALADELEVKRYEEEYAALKNLFAQITDEPADIGMYGGAIYWQNQLIAFAIYSNDLGDCPICHFEKAHPDFLLAFPLIAQECLRNEFPTATLVNREEDLGLAGLRKNKLSYRPVEIYDKPMVILRKKK